MIQVLMDIDETMIAMPKGISAKTSAIMFKKVFGVNANEEMIENVGKTEMAIILEILHKVGYKIQEVPEEAYRIWAEETEQELIKNPVRLLPGVQEFLTELSSNPKVKLQLLTGNSPWRAKVKLKSAKIENYFIDTSTDQLNGVFGNIAIKRSELLNSVINEAKPGDKFIIIDDSLIGAKMAKEHNTAMISVATGKATEEELKIYTEHVFPNLGDDRWQKAISFIETLQL